MDEIYFLTHDETKKLLDDKSDNSFDFDFNVLTYCTFFQAGEFCSDIFYDFQYALSSLHRYLEYTNRYLTSYLSDGVNFGQELINQKHLGAEYFDMHIETFGSDQDYLKDYLFQSILIALYSVFEKLLKDVSNDLQTEQTIDVSINQYKGAMYQKYLKYLSKECHMKVAYNLKIRRDFEMFRKVRNDVIHSGCIIKDQGLKKDILKSKNLKLEMGKVIIGYDYLIEIFELIGNMAKELEISYWNANGKYPTY